MNSLQEASGESHEEIRARLLRIADEWSAMAANGLFYPIDEVDGRLLAGVRGIAADVYAALDGGTAADEFDAALAARPGLRTPLPFVALWIHGQTGSAVLVRAGERGPWAMPRSLVATQDSVRSTAERMMGEFCMDMPPEPKLHSIVDTASLARDEPHGYCFVLDIALDHVLPDPIGRQRGNHHHAEPTIGSAEVDHHLLAALAPGGERGQSSRFDADRLYHVAQQLANEGLARSTDPYNRVRYGRVYQLADALLALDGQRFTRRALHGVAAAAPAIGVEAAIFNAESWILLVRRSDTGTWAMPGGMCDVGESSASAIAREVVEEISVEISPGDIVGVYDNRLIGAAAAAVHIVVTYACELLSGVAQVSSEVSECRWFAESDLASIQLFHGHAVKIRDALHHRSGALTGTVLY